MHRTSQWYKITELKNDYRVTTTRALRQWTLPASSFILALRTAGVDEKKDLFYVAFCQGSWFQVP